MYIFFWGGWISILPAILYFGVNRRVDFDYPFGASVPRDEIQDWTRDSQISPVPKWFLDFCSEFLRSKKMKVLYPAW